LEKLRNRVLVYIPCHTDFVEALNQASTLREDFKNYSNSVNSHFDQLYIVLSVNSYSPTSDQLAVAEGLCDEVINFGESLLADVNISQGFVCSLRIKPSVFWLLSANDCLLPGALTRVLRTFEDNHDLDLIVGNSKLESKRYREYDMGNINGVISGVVYNTTNLKQFFNVAPFFPWTGWSHLAVIESAMNANHGLEILPIPQECLYTQTNRAMNLNGSIYAHSFTGDMIQKFLFRQNRSQRKKSLRKFIRLNFYRVHLYSVRDSKPHRMNEMVNPDHYLSWNSLIASSILKANTPFFYVFYRTCKKIPFELLYNRRFFRRIQSRL
jgi:hypothetical protein